MFWVLDPVKNTVEAIPVQPRNAKGYSTKVDYYHGREIRGRLDGQPAQSHAG